MWHLDPMALINVEEVDLFKIINDKDLGKQLTDPELNPVGEYWIVAIFKSGNKVEIVNLGFPPPTNDQEGLTTFFRNCQSELRTFSKDLYESGCIKIDELLLKL